MTADDVKSWALLAYTVADDKSTGATLDSAARMELQAMCDAADFERLNIAAQVDFKHSRGAFRGVITQALRGVHQGKDADNDDADINRYPLWRSIVEHLKTSTLTLDIDHREPDAASARVLQAFLRFGHRECPAQRHMLYFFGHGYGPMGLFFDSGARTRTAHTLRLNDLADSLEVAERKASVVLFRDCYMNTLEAAYQLKGVTDFMIASQAEAPIAGVWPWKRFLQELHPMRDSEATARAITEHLGAFLDHPDNRGILADVPIALLDLQAVDAIVEPLTALVDALEHARGDQACALALERARIGNPETPAIQPGDPALLDVPTMCENLIHTGLPHVERAAHALGHAIADRLVLSHHSQHGVYRGTSIYYKPVRPRDIAQSHIQQEDAEAAADDAKAYKELALNRATGWHRIALHPLASARDLA